MNEEQGRTELEDLGEFGLIKRLTEGRKNVNKSSVLGVGDDAAVIGSGKILNLLTTDLLIEGVHFDMSYVPLKHLGYKAVVVNLSDIYAMNGTPEQITVSIAVSNRFSVEALEEIYSGIYLACEKYKVDLVGGDTSSSTSGLMISISALGTIDKNELVRRSGAKEHDLLVVSGDLGAAYMGLQLLEREKAVFLEDQNIQPDLGSNDYILERQLKPEARKDIIERFKAQELLPTSMIDISDGLASEVIHLCKNSNVGCHVYDEKLPIDPSTYQMAVDFNMDPTTCALNGGEDYELLFTIDQKDIDKVKGDPNLTIIGHITNKEKGMYLIDKHDGAHTLTAQGWDQFLKKELQG